MTVDQESLGVVEPMIRRTHAPVAGMHPLQQASKRLSEFREGRSLLKAKDLVGLLLCHGARAWRSSQPVAHPRLLVSAPNGQRAVHLRFG